MVSKFFIVTGTVANQVPTFAISDTKLYIPVVTLSIQDNAKLLQQLKSHFERTIKWTKMFLVAEEAKQTISNFSQGTVKVL